MTFIDAFNSVTPASFKRIGDPGFGSKEAKGLIDLGDLIDSSLESVIKLQEAGIPFANILYSKAPTAIRNSTVGGSLIRKIETALDQENTIWKTSWMGAKTTYGALLVPPVGPGFPVKLFYPAPIIPAAGPLAGTGFPLPTGAIFLSSFQSLTASYGTNANYIGLAIQKLLTELYVKWANATPWPLYPPSL